ncbi:hypothetical protein BJ742DRAFT_822322 [Cladochytrium replicatum]|nr:hypothetical protein BJ742DRAFT_822322 [Cladochytrium replicatum]
MGGGLSRRKTEAAAAHPEMTWIEVEVGNVGDLQDGQMKEVAVGEGKALLSKIAGTYHATSHVCPHYKAPLKSGAISGDGRVVCPWHGACLNVTTGDIEDGPTLDALAKYEVVIKGDKVFVKAKEEDIKAARRAPTWVKKLGADNTTAVVLGGGAAGLVSVESLRQEGFTGRIVLVSREPYLPIDRPKLSKGLKIDASKIQLRDASHFSQLDVEVHLSTEALEVASATKTVTLSNGSSINYDFLVVATGADPRTIPVQGKELKNIYTLRSATDANAIEAGLAAFGEKPNVVIVGSSFIGMEAAAVLAKTNNVTVIGMEKVPFERVLGSKLGNAFKNLFETSGVTLKLEAVVDHFIPATSDSSRIGGVVLKTGETIAADVVLLGAGVIPKTDFLKSSGIVLDRDGGITVEASLKVPELDGVFVAGDVARYPYHLTGDLVRIEHWDVAQNQGRLVGKNIAALSKNKAATLKPFVAVPFFWTGFFGKSVRYAGHAHTFDDVIVQGSTELENLGFVAFFVHKGEVLAVATLGRDPAAAHSAELLRLKRFPPASEFAAGKDVLSISLA